MKEIKFRAWDKEKKGMFNWYFTEKGLFPSDFFNNSDYEVMQFTGLHDKNGKEIYEGDIIETRVSGKSGSAIKAVIWNTKYCGFNIKDDEELEREIIGNIYETPELLN